MSTSQIVSDLCLARVISELAESSEDLYSCLRVNHMWCKCAVAYLWQTPFHWTGDKAGRMVGKFLQLLPKGYIDDLEYVMGIYVPPHNTRPTFNYLQCVKTMN